jgi:anti-anti-sigma factor
MTAHQDFGWMMEVSSAGEDTRISFTGHDVALDEGSTEWLADELSRLVEEQGRCRLLLDLANVVYLNSGTLGVLLLLHRKLQRVGGQLRLCNVSEFVYEIFAITHLHRLIEVRRAGEPATCHT